MARRQRRDHAILADALHDVVAPGAHEIGNVRRRLAFLEGQFWMLVEVMAPGFTCLEPGSELVHKCIHRMSPGLRPLGTVTMIDTMAATTISRLNSNAIRAAWRTATLS